MTSSKYGEYKFLLISLLGCGIIVAGVVFGLERLLSAEVSNKQDYVSTIGELTQLSVSPKVVKSGNYGTVQWMLTLEYTYRIGEKAYTGNRYAVNGNPFAINEEYLYTKIGNISKGERVKVFYLKNDPSFSVLTLKLM